MSDPNYFLNRDLRDKEHAREVREKAQEIRDVQKQQAAKGNPMNIAATKAFMAEQKKRDDETARVMLALIDAQPAHAKDPNGIMGKPQEIQIPPPPPKQPLPPAATPIPANKENYVTAQDVTIENLGSGTPVLVIGAGVRALSFVKDDGSAAALSDDGLSIKVGGASTDLADLDLYIYVTGVLTVQTFKVPL